MPELQFYAARQDIVTLLEFVYGETDCRVFEAYSAPDSEPREFGSIAVSRSGRRRLVAGRRSNASS